MDYFLGEIRLFAFNFPPNQWAFCTGTQMAIQQNAALFALLGTQFGGNGTTNFNLPDLRGRTPVHMQTTISTTLINTGPVGAPAGADSVTLLNNQAPDHLHPVVATSDPGSAGRASNKSANVSGMAATVQKNPNNPNPNPTPIYVAPGAANTMQQLSPATVTPISAAVPHENRQPFLAANYCISLTGIFPSRP